MDWRFTLCAVWLLALGYGSGQAAEARFGAVRQASNGWLILEGQIPTNRLITLETSADLTNWTSSAWLDDRIVDLQTGEAASTRQSFQFTEPMPAPGSGRFYRFRASGFTDTNDWKNQACLPLDWFANEPPDPGSPRVRWLKFVIRADSMARVDYQDSRRYLLHYDFAVAHWPQFGGLNRDQFDQISLFSSRRQVLLGTLLMPPDLETLEYGVQFSSRDPLPRETVRQAMELVASTIAAAPGTRAFYMPSFEQTETAAIDADFFAECGIRVSTVNRWLEGNQVYSAGWTLGRLHFVPASQIAARYASGELLPGDILLTDGVPAEVPFVAGILSSAPATPNSHVAILATTYGVPFAYVADTNLLERLRRLEGKEIVVQATSVEGFGRISVIPVEGTLDAAERAELLARKASPSAAIKPKATYGAVSASVDGLRFDDVRFFGGKASQYGLLRRTIPDHALEAVAFSFDLWDAFMAQPFGDGGSLGLAIQRRLAGLTYPEDVAAMRAHLSVIRDWITRTARFAPEQQHAILNALAPFDPSRKLRFRSSSNAEDAQSFVAAGLYDSYSGCLADDSDGDASGPCRCDAAEANERGVFRAMQKVYASFYNDNAYLERRRHGLDETQVGMALLVHYSAPDEEELANGVATVERIQAQFGQSYLLAKLVTQRGAVSVTNPEGNARPEIVECTASGDPTLDQNSSLVPMGDHVLQWTDDYAELSRLLFRVYEAYGRALPQANDAANLMLDFEYKKLKPGQLVVKQVRALPRPALASATPFLLNEPTAYWLYQREGITVFANHRLKCLASFQTITGELNRSNLTDRLYTEARMELRRGDQKIELTGAPSSWPNATHTLSQDPRSGWVVTDSWTLGTGPDEWRVELESTLPLSASASAPFIPQGEIRKRLRVTYATPQPIYDTWSDLSTNTIQEEIQLILQPATETLKPIEPVTYSASGLLFQVTFLESSASAGPPVGADKSAWGYYLAALSPSSRTRITGLLADPLELSGYYSQSASPGHKNLETQFLFQPSLDPGVSASQRAELERRDIRLVFVRHQLIGNRTAVKFLGKDGKFRDP